MVAIALIGTRLCNSEVDMDSINNLFDGFLVFDDEILQRFEKKKGGNFVFLMIMKHYSVLERENRENNLKKKMMCIWRN